MPKLHQKDRGSITLGLVFGLGMLGLGIGATTLVFSTNTLTNNSNAASGVRTLITADAATREGIYRVLKEVSGTTMNFTNTILPILNNESSNADIAVTGTWPVFEVRGTAVNHRTIRKVVADIDLFPSGEAFDKAVYTNGELDFGGNVTIEGDVYATEGIDLGGSAEINGNASTPEDINTTGSADVTGESIENNPVILPPMIDISGYETDAITNGTYYSASGGGGAAAAAIKNHTLTGTYYIDDDLSINGNGTDFTGIIVVTGDLTLTGGVYTVGGDSPIVLYVKGDLTLSGNLEVNGIVYVEGETTFGAGTPEINGSLISVSGANKAVGGGSITINYDPVYAKAWHELFEDGILDGAPPEVSEWHEE